MDNYYNDESKSELFYSTCINVSQNLDIDQ